MRFLEQFLQCLAATRNSDVRQSVPPGHFYSPIPSLNEVKRNENWIFGECARTLPDVAMNEQNQLELLKSFKHFYAEIPFKEGKTPGLRYYFENSMYSYSDAIMFYCMIRHLKPKRVIEIGSGFSSCITLDTNEKFLGNTIKPVFIEPFPERLLSLLKGSDREQLEIHSQRLQDIDLGLFDQLQRNDILFIDSTHVSKVGSDVNRIFFDILPRLPSGTYVHFHDIFYPFEYPRDWIFAGRSWNEAYLLRAFLQNNADYQVVLMNSYLHRFHPEFFTEEMPLCNRNTGGSIWLRKQYAP